MMPGAILGPGGTDGTFEPFPNPQSGITTRLQEFCRVGIGHHALGPGRTDDPCAPGSALQQSASAPHIAVAAPLEDVPLP
jgi:hypothetical protein